MTHKVLLVDDEVNLLQSLRRSFRNKYDLKLADGGQQALSLLRVDSTIAVVVSDMQMPEVNGLKVLTEARKLCPNTVRIMLTGNIDQQTAVDAVNQGGVFRFVNKPCEPEHLADAIDEAIKLHDQLIAEKTLLSRTLTAAIGIGTELLALANPKAHGRGNRLKDLGKKLALKLGLQEHWQLEIASMLSQIGCLSHPSVDEKSQAFHDDRLPFPFSAEWDAMLASQADASSKIVAKIPRFEKVAAIIRMQSSSSSGTELSESDRRCSRILRMLIDFDLLSQSNSINSAFALMQNHLQRYDTQAFQEFVQMISGDCVVKHISLRELLVGMTLEDHVVNGSGDILISKGHELTESIIQRLKNFARNPLGIREPILVRCISRELAL